MVYNPSWLKKVRNCTTGKRRSQLNLRRQGDRGIVLHPLDFVKRIRTAYGLDGIDPATTKQYGNSPTSGKRVPTYNRRTEGEEAISFNLGWTFIISYTTTRREDGGPTKTSFYDFESFHPCSGGSRNIPFLSSIRWKDRTIEKSKIEPEKAIHRRLDS